MGYTSCAQSGLGSDIFGFEVSHQCIDAAEFEIAPENQPHTFGLVLDDGNLVVFHLITEGQGTTDPEALTLGGSDLVPNPLGVTSRSNWAKDSSTLSVSRPIEVVVLNCWVTETKDTPWASNSSTSLAKSANDRVRRSTL